MLRCATVPLQTVVNLILSRFNCSLPHVEKRMHIWSFEFRAIDLNVPITHTTIHCKLKLCKTKVYLTHRHIKMRTENSCVGVLEAASGSSSMVHAIVLTINSIFLILHIVFCSRKTGKRAKRFTRQNSGWAARRQPWQIKISYINLQNLSKNYFNCT